MEHSHHDGHEPKKQSALYSYIAAFVVIAGFLTYINSMNCCCSGSCHKKNSTEEVHGEHHGEQEHGGEHGGH